jgi:predicted peptidase
MKLPTTRWTTFIALFGFMLLSPGLSMHGATEDEGNSDVEVRAALKKINKEFKNTEVQLVHWPRDLQKQLGNLKRIAFMAYPESKPSGKLPLLITLHGGGGKQMSLTKQLVRSAQVKGLALAELAGKDLILLDPNSADSWDPNSLDRMLDFVLDTYDEVDKDRVYVMGHSMGGAGTWDWIRHSPDRFAAAAPCGFSTATDTEGIEKLTQLPIWATVGGEDGKNVAAIETMVANLRAVGNKQVGLTAFPGANHSKGNAAVFSSVGVVDWMLSFSLSE